MASEDIDYKVFTATLKKRKAELELELKAVDAAIHAIAVLPVPTERHVRSAAPYRGLKAQAATKLYLKQATERQATSEVVEGLQEGGFTTKSENVYSIVYTALRRLRDDTTNGVTYDEDRKWFMKK